MTTTPNDLTDRVGRVIDTELTRLRHRQPALTSAQLSVIEQTLSDLADRLFLDAMRRNPTLWPRIEPLFTNHYDHLTTRRE